MRHGLQFVAKMLGVTEEQVTSEFGRAIGCSKPDASEVYDVVEGVRRGARRASSETRWWVSLDKRHQPWEQALYTSLSG